MNINLDNEHLHNLFQNKKIPHALIFQSANSESAYRYAFELVSGLFCKKDSHKPCKICSSCIKVLKGIHPDVKTISPLEDCQFIKIDQIREIRRDAYIIPNEEDYKVYIINPAHLLTVEAQNAFIKILESPPKNIIFILITESTSSLLPTILSRCEVFNIFTKDYETNELNSAQIARDIVKLSASCNKIEIFKIISSLASEERVFIKDVVINISRNLMEVIRQSKDLNLLSDIMKKIENLSEIIKFIDENINLNLIISYLNAILLK